MINTLSMVSYFMLLFRYKQYNVSAVVSQNISSGDTFLARIFPYNPQWILWAAQLVHIAELAKFIKLPTDHSAHLYKFYLA